MVRDDPCVGISADRANAPLPDPINYLARLRSQNRQIAQAQDLVDTGAVKLGQNRIKSNQIAVNVGDQSDPHVRSVASRRRR